MSRVKLWTNSCNFLSSSSSKKFKEKLAAVGWKFTKYAYFFFEALIQRLFLFWISICSTSFQDANSFINCRELDKIVQFALLLPRNRTGLVLPWKQCSIASELRFSLAIIIQRSICITAGAIAGHLVNKIFCKLFPCHTDNHSVICILLTWMTCECCKLLVSTTVSLSSIVALTCTT